jgi:hypothetical protein
MFIERLVLFVVLGFFVFSPTIGTWLEASAPYWYRHYLPWLMVIALCAWLHMRADSRSADEENQTERQSRDA